MLRQAVRVLLGRMSLTATAYPLGVWHERMWVEFMLRRAQHERFVVLLLVRGLLFAMLAGLGRLAGLAAALLMMYACTSCMA